MFEHLEKLEVADATSWIDLPEVTPEARILLKHAGETNTHYYNAMLRRSGKRARKMVRTDAVDAEMLAKNRDEDRDLFPKFVFAGWEGIQDVEGNPVPFSRKSAAEFCAKCPGWIFDRIRNHAATPERFLPVEEEDGPDVDELAKNSASVSASN